MKINTKFAFEDKVEDAKTGFCGIITIIYLYPDEPPRYVVQPKCDLTYILPEAEVFSEGRLKLISSANNLKVI